MPRDLSYDWTYNQLNFNKIYILPSGTYFIGDIFYVIGESLTKDIYNKAAYESGYYKSKNACFLVGDTSSNDYYYIGSDKKKYMVDNGIIGIISANLICDPDTSGGQIYTFENEVAVKINNGVFKFSSYLNNNEYFQLIINTISNNESESVDSE